MIDHNKLWMAARLITEAVKIEPKQLGRLPAVKREACFELRMIAGKVQRWADIIMELGPETEDD